jgi:hypothetical protein
MVKTEPFDSRSVWYRPAPVRLRDHGRDVVGSVSSRGDLFDQAHIHIIDLRDQVV